MVAILVAKKSWFRGCICKTGIGIANAAYKTKNICCILTQSPLIAKIAKENYDANVLALGGKLLELV